MRTLRNKQRGWIGIAVAAASAYAQEHKPPEQRAREAASDSVERWWYQERVAMYERLMKDAGRPWFAAAGIVLTAGSLVLLAMAFHL